MVGDVVGVTLTIATIIVPLDVESFATFFILLLLLLVVEEYLQSPN
jgi:hypothetical protein